MTISDTCRTVAALADQAAAWARDNAAELRSAAPDLQRQLLRKRDIANQLGKAATLPGGVGVFGASQVGKSYLIGALARGGAPKLEIQLGSRTRNFLEEINPVGNKESTGIVTRFSIKPSVQPPAGYPVIVKLFSQIDIVRIFSNSFFLDFDQKEEKVPPLETVKATLEAARSRVQSADTDGLSSRDIDWLHYYLHDRFSSRGTIKLLDMSGYWDEVEAIAPRLRSVDRIPLFALLWGGLQRFTELFSQLYGVLSSLEFNETVFCEEKALVPREHSIIDAFTLRKLSDVDTPSIAVSTSNGKRADVPLPLLAALVAELNLTLTRSAHDFLQHSDILDFPGARTRHNWKDASAILADPEKLAEAILRGKVAYLFERFTAEFALNSLALCVKVGPQDVPSVSDYVTPWIESVHGRSADDRRMSKVALFLTLTYFDTFFGRKAGGVNNWGDAIKTSVVDLFGGTGGWVRSWCPGKPFDNIFWIRNPTVIDEGLMIYGDSFREEGIRNPEWVRQRKAEYSETDLVKTHIADHDRAFDAAFDLNDGGVTYLAKKLAEVAKADLRDTQIRNRLQTLKVDLYQMLEPLHVPDAGSEAMVERRRKAVEEAISSLRKTMQARRFGHFLKDLMVDHEDIVAALSRVNYSQDVPAAIFGAAHTPDELRRVLGGLLGDADREGETADMPEQISGNGVLARQALDAWGARLSQLADDGGRLNAYGLTPAVAANIKRELLEGAVSTRLHREITAHLDRIIMAHDSPGRRADKVATVAVEYISRYALGLGQSSKPPSQRVPNAQGRPVHDPRPRPETLERIGNEAGARALTTFGDWCTSFNALSDDNLKQAGAGNANSAMNRALGALLERIKQETDPS